MSKEIKDVLQLLAFTVPLFAGLFVYWFHSPMYRESWELNRARAVAYLSAAYYYPADFVPEDRDKMMKYYKITEAEIHPQELFGIKK